MDVKDFNFDFEEFDMNFDFGIQSVSTDQVDQTKIQTEKLEKVSASSEGVSQKLVDIENKIEEVLLVSKQKFDSRLEERESELEAQNENKFKSLEKLTIPLLMNLARDSDENPYIHWPNRKAVIEEQVKRILMITRHEPETVGST